MEHSESSPLGRAELLILMFHAHQQAPPAVVGIIVHESGTNRAELRVLQHWNHFEEHPELEVLRESLSYFHELLEKHGAESFLEHLEQSLSNSIRVQRLRMAFDPGPINRYADAVAALLLGC